MGHANLSASGAKKWLSCPASVGYAKALKKADSTSSYAAEGTAAHFVVYTVLSTGVDPDSLLGQHVHMSGSGEAVYISEKADGQSGILIDDDMALAAHEVNDFIREQNPDGVFLEVKVDFSDYVPEGNGTADIGLYRAQEKTLHVIDFKYGKGVYVYAEENPQLRLYALGFLKSVAGIIGEVEAVKTTIIQPRLNNISTETLYVKELTTWGEEYVKPRAMKAAECISSALTSVDLSEWMKRNADKFNPTEEGCRWCAVRTTCRARASHMLDSVLEGFTEIPSEPVSKNSLKKLSGLTPKELSVIYLSSTAITSWLSDIKEEVKNLLENGEECGDLELVESLGNRSWFGEPSEIMGALKSFGFSEDSIIKRSLLSPAQTEALFKKVFKKEYLEEFQKISSMYIIRPTGSSKIVQRKEVKGKNNILDFT